MSMVGEYRKIVMGILIAPIQDELSSSVLELHHSFTV